MGNLTVFEEIKYASILQLVDKSTVIDDNWLPYLKSDKKGQNILKALKKISSLSSYDLILEKHEGWTIPEFIEHYL
jgi:hypothetical protein